MNEDEKRSVLARLDENDALARAALLGNAVWRGQRRSGETESRLPSLCFGSFEAASVYAENPNDRSFAESEHDLSPFVFPAALVPKRVFATEPPGDGDPFIDVHVVEALFGKAIARRFVRDLSSCMENTNAWEEIRAETGHDGPLDAYDAGAGAPPALFHEAFRLPWFAALLASEGYDAALTGGCGANALEDEWHVLDRRVVRAGFAEVAKERRRAEAVRAATEALRSVPDMEDPESVSPDLAFFEIYPEDVSCWKFASIPALAVASLPGSVGDALPGEDPITAGERWSSLIRWMAERGGAANALRESPVIATLDAGGFELIDGWHRCVVAREIYGVTEVPVVVAVKSWPKTAAPRAGGPEI